MNDEHRIGLVFGMLGIVASACLAVIAVLSWPPLMEIALWGAVSLSCLCIGLTLSGAQSRKARRLQFVFLGVALAALAFFAFKVQ